MEPKEAANPARPASKVPRRRETAAPKAFTNHSNLYQAKGDMDSALQDFEEAIHLNPDNVFALFNRGTVRQAKGDSHGGLEDFHKALRLGYKPN